MTKKIIPQCCGKNMHDFCYYRHNILQDKVEHFFCSSCCGRIHDGKRYTMEEWFFFINETLYEEEQTMQSMHAHELINHSDPEIPF